MRSPILRLLRNYYGKEKKSCKEEEALSAPVAALTRCNSYPLDRKIADLLGDFSMKLCYYPPVISFKSLFGVPAQKIMAQSAGVVAKVNAFAPSYEALSEQALKEKTHAFRNRLAAGETEEELLPEAFAAVREAARRTVKLRHFDVQLVGGLVLNNRGIAEMKTCEGKTLVATLPAYLNALEGKGVHLVTVNEYLAMRDAAWMGEIYHALGLTTGCITHSESYVYDPTHQNPSDPLDKERDAEGGFKIVHEFLRPVLKAQAYKADIIYGTNNEYGFDYLRDNLVQTKDDMVQREHAFAIVDEVDSILIDEA